jgi:hypothetical protein
MGHIFISYSHKDTEYAHGLANNLQNMGFDIWIDARIDYGSQWPYEIEKQLDSCDAFILVMSRNSYASEWVQSELQRAKRKLKPIFPLLLDGDEPWLSIESTQYYDVRGGKFPDAWFYAALKRVSSIKQNAQTFLGLKKNIMPAPAAAGSSAPKYKIEVVIAVIGAAATIFAACATVFVGVVSSPVFDKFLHGSESAGSLPAVVTAEPSPTNPPPLSVVSNSISTETSLPAVLPTATLATTLPPPPTPTAAPLTVTNNYEYVRDNGNIAGVQKSKSLDYTLNVDTVDLLQIEIKIPLTDNEVIFHVLLDDVEVYTTERMGLVRATSDLIDLSSFISRGTHKLTISPEGIFGGSNVGTLWIYGATLIVHTNAYP